MLNWGILNFGVKCEEVEFGYLFMVEFEGVIYTLNSFKNSRLEFSKINSN